MPSKNKDRLYVGLYARGGNAKMPGLEDKYHWAILTGPKSEADGEVLSGVHHVRERVLFVGDPPVVGSVWEYDSTTDANSMLLIRIVVGKIKDLYLLEALLRGSPLRPELPGWNCVAWVKEALRVVGWSGALGTCTRDWGTIRDTAMWYVEQKKENHRFDGQGVYDNTRTATWDMLAGEEVIA